MDPTESDGIMFDGQVDSIEQNHVIHWFYSKINKYEKKNIRGICVSPSISFIHCYAKPNLKTFANEHGMEQIELLELIDQ